MRFSQVKRTKNLPPQCPIWRREYALFVLGRKIFATDKTSPAFRSSLHFSRCQQKRTKFKELREKWFSQKGCIRADKFRTDWYKNIDRTILSVRLMLTFQYFSLLHSLSKNFSYVVNIWNDIYILTYIYISQRKIYIYIYYWKEEIFERCVMCFEPNILLF